MLGQWSVKRRRSVEAKRAKARVVIAMGPLFCLTTTPIPFCGFEDILCNSTP